MKKIILPLLLICFILITNSTDAKVIILSNCSLSDEKFTKFEMDKSEFEKNEFVININQKLVKKNIVYSDSYIKNQNEKIKKIDGSSPNFDKILSVEYQIEYSDSKFVKAKRNVNLNNSDVKFTIEINLKDKTITETTDYKLRSFRNYTYCGGGAGNKDFLNKIIGK